MEEIYKVIKGFENYSVSNLGNVINNKTDEILKASLDRDEGYKKVALHRKTFRVHRLVAEAFIPNPNNKTMVDHIDNDKTNNNVNNLRWATNSENQFNQSISKNNTSGTKGVVWHKHKNKWQATIRHNNKLYHLGYFDKLENARIARHLKANELFKEYTNSCERIVNLNIEIPKNTKLNINIKVKDDEDEEYRKLEKEFEELLK
jgi:hypothetical protein